MGTDRPRHFIRDIIEKDLAEGVHDGRVATRFPPEPNGYLHIGHAKSICLNFGLALDYDGTCNLRFDDTNPLTENEEYVESIKDAVRWLGFEWDNLCFASDYFEQFYDYAVKLIKQGDAYVDSLSDEEIREYRGTVTEPGKESPYRDRSVDENLELFKRMRDGAFEDGEHVLRAKIDMSSPHMIMRDPLLFRILHAEHYRTGDEWCIYPMYDFAHCLEDAIENITHSLCTLEFDNNRRVYDWVLEHCLEPEELPQRPHQYEFNRLNLDYTVVSKRKLLRLVEEGHVSGWDDPRLPTLAGLRRRGVPPSAVRHFCSNVGITRTQGSVQLSQFEHAVRDTLNYEAPRYMAVLDPLPVEIRNLDEEQSYSLDGDLWPREIDREGLRALTFERDIYIDRSDFRVDPNDDFYRLAPGREVRLRHGYFITCKEIVRDEDGRITKLICTYDPETADSTAPDGREPSATIHWLSQSDAREATFRQYDRLFDHPEPDAEGDFIDHINPASLIEKSGFVEKSIPTEADARVQFEREGYYWQDPEDSNADQLVFNRIVSLRDAWADEGTSLSKDELDQLRREKARRKQELQERAEKHQKDPVELLDEEQTGRFESLKQEGLSKKDAVVIARHESLTEYFREAVRSEPHPSAIANWIINELLAVMDRPDDEPPIAPEHLAQLVALQEEDAINSRVAQDVFNEMLASGRAPRTIVEEKGLRQIDDESELEATVREIVSTHPDERQRYRDGKKALIGFFIGQVMQETQGRANPNVARELLEEALATNEA